MRTEMHDTDRQDASAFDLPDLLVAKADPALIADDDQHFERIAGSLEQSIATLSGRLDAARKAPGGIGQEAMERDMEIHRLTARLRTLRRYGLDLCLGRIVGAADLEPVYIGRLGLTDGDGRRLLLDWRTAAAEPFFAATHAHPMGLASRRRYRWTDGRISDYWDEVFTPDGLEGHAALDDQSAFIATLGANRSSRMRDVLGTIQADQDAIIRAGARGALVVDGGPGTGKTVVALHRTAYLLYSDPRLGHRRGGVLFVGPSRPYLAYVADVLPSLGEEGVQTCTLRDLAPEGAAAVPETDPYVARLKASAEMVAAIAPAVALYEEPPTTGMSVDTDWSEVWLSATDWAQALPLLDAARQRLGEVGASRRRQQQDATLAAEREQMDRVIDELAQAAGDAYGVGLVTSLRHEDLQEVLVDEAAQPHISPDALVGPFAHIVVDEAQELTDAQWQMLLTRCPSQGFTIVGDRAQARHGFTDSWEQRLERIGLSGASVTSLNINYRTPAEVMAEAEPVIRGALPDANVPTSIRSNGIPVTAGPADDLASVLDTWLAGHREGIACVIGIGEMPGGVPRDSSRVRWLSPELSKGLEFDLVVLIDPDTFGSGIEGAVDRYVAMTRATQQLVILTSS